jgi:starch-binding outer membrane protein SusE/F
MDLNGDYKFLSPKPNGTFDWGTPDWGDDGSFSGTLGSAGNCTVGAGYYLVKVNTSTTGPGALQYSATAITWSVCGSGTPLGWPAGQGIAGQDHDMTYSAVTKKWTVTLALTGGGELKFRANDRWDVNLGKFDANKVNDDFGGADMSYGGGNIPVATSGTYTITLDVSNPRAYKYSIQ